MQPNEEFAAAFAADDTGLAPIQDDPVALEKDEVADNQPDAAAAEGAGDEKTAAAVKLDDAGEAGAKPDGSTDLIDAVEGEGEADEPMSPEDAQRQKSWEGRLKKREEELAAREAALAGQGATPDEGADTAGDEAPVESEGGEPDLLAELSADYGEDFVKKIVELVKKEVTGSATELVTPVAGRIDSMIDDVQKAFASMHFSSIADAHEDFEEIVEGAEFQGWLDSMPDDQKAAAQEVVERGSAGKVIRLLQQFKDSLKTAEESAPAEQSPEDVWAEDAATSVKGSAPLKLPTRAPASPQDEYKRAWEEV